MKRSHGIRRHSAGWCLQVYKLQIIVGRPKHYHWGDTYYTPIIFRWRGGMRW